jgi:hypothetical protein
MVRRSIFDKIFKEMQTIRFRLDDLEKSISGWSPPPMDISETKLISLSDHLRMTYLTVASKGEVDATEVSSSTGRCRALESNYLNQLCRMGWLNKRKVSKSTFFFIASAKPPKIQPTKPEAINLRTPLGSLGNGFRKCFIDSLDEGKSLRIG